MPQFRLTAAMAKDLKVKELSEPRLDLPRFYDDWYLDTIRAMRKKVVIAMHVRTRMAIAITLSDIGGLKKVFDFFPFILKHHLFECQLDRYADACIGIEGFYAVEDGEYTFTKTNNRSVNAHMTQFKHLLESEAYRYGAITQKVCDVASRDWLEWLVKTPESGNDYTRPFELWQLEYGVEGQNTFNSDQAVDTDESCLDLTNVLQFPTGTKK